MVSAWRRSAHGAEEAGTLEHVVAPNPCRRGARPMVGAVAVAVADAVADAVAVQPRGVGERSRSAVEVPWRRGGMAV